MERLTIDRFGEIIDDFLNDNHIQLVIDMEEGTRKAIIKDNAGMGPVIQFYILMHGMAQCMDSMVEIMGIEKSEKSGILDGILDILRKEVLDEVNHE